MAVLDFPNLRPCTSPDEGAQQGVTTPALVRGHPRPTPRTFWCAGGSICFRDADGAVRPLHIIRLRQCVHALWRLARESRDAERIAYATLFAEAQEALNDAMSWRRGASIH